MQERKLKIGFARFPYAGNGGSEAEDPSIADWLVKTTLAIKADPRCEDEVWSFCKSDTPIPMVRNEALKRAMDAGVDVLVMIDSDQIPDLHLGTDPEAKPFWDTSFEFLYQHWDKGPCCIAAPYCGGFPHPIKGGTTNVYVAEWRANEDDPVSRVPSLEILTREEAARRVGIEEMSAVPTGLYMIDTRVGKILKPEWFYYKYHDPPYNTRKSGTEDFNFTRDASLAGVPQFCNWDAWAGHRKSRISGKPRIMSIDHVRENLRAAILSGLASNERITELEPGRDTSAVLRELEQEKARSDREAANLPTSADRLRRDKGKFRVVDRKYGVDLGEVSEQGKLYFNTTDDEIETVRNLVKVLVEENPDRPLQILEIGTWAGHTACAIHDALGSQGGTVYCVDTWEGGDGDITQFNARLYGTKNVRAVFEQNRERRTLEPIEMTSEKAARHPDVPREFDLIFIDGDHSPEAIKQDLDLWAHRVRIGGILSGHDYDLGMFPGVVAEVKKRCPEFYTRGRVWYQAIGDPATPDTQVESEPITEGPAVESPTPPVPEPTTEPIENRFTPGDHGSVILQMRRGETLDTVKKRLAARLADDDCQIPEGQKVQIKPPEPAAV
jgi:predicted O-methyltransferase YrrM